jgi:RNA polymerase sigma factor (sigma-70 family)
MMAGCDCPPFDCQDLVNRYKAGERTAGDALCLKFKPLIWSIVTRVLGQKQVADWEDACQAVFERIFWKLSTWQARCPFCKWLAIVATRRVIDLKRRRGMGELTQPEEILASVPDPVDPAIIECIKKTVASFPAPWKAVWELHVEMTPHADIAKHVGHSLRTVQYWLAEMRERLRPCVKD